MSWTEVYDLGRQAIPVAASFYAAFLLAMLVHEIGHVVFAIAASIPIRLLSVGAGPVLFQARISEMRIELRPLPLVGFAAPYPVLVLRRWRYILFLMGGVLGNVGAIGIIACLDIAKMIPDWADGGVGKVVFIQLFFIFMNLFPFVERRRHLPSDGLQLFRLLRTPRDGATAAGLAYAARLSRYSGDPKQQPSTSAASSRINYHLSRPDQWASEEVRHDINRAMQRELARGGLPREEEMLVLDSMITSALVFEERAPPAYLESGSKRAFELGPSSGTMRGSRGAALVALGRCLEGKALLEPLADNDIPSFDSFMSQVFLTLACSRLGDIEAARHWSNAAHAALAALGASPALVALLARIDAEIATRSAANATSVAPSGS